MKQFIKFIYFFLISCGVLFPIVVCGQYRDLSALIHAIDHNQCKLVRYNQQITLIEQLQSHKKPLPTNTLNKCRNALLYDQNFPLLIQHNNIISSGMNHLKKNPDLQFSFYATVQNALAQLRHPVTAKGFFYEIEQAVRIAQKDQSAIPADDQEIVLCLNVTIESPYSSLKRQFDIITNKRWYECKNFTQWPMNNGNVIKLQKQFLEQQQIVREYNAAHDDTIEYIICSKQIIPAWWQEWFETHNIHYLVTEPVLTLPEE